MFGINSDQKKTLKFLRNIREKIVKDIKMGNVQGVTVNQLLDILSNDEINKDKYFDDQLNGNYDDYVEGNYENINDEDEITLLSDPVIDTIRNHSKSLLKEFNTQRGEEKNNSRENVILKIFLKKLSKDINSLVDVINNHHTTNKKFATRQQRNPHNNEEFFNLIDQEKEIKENLLNSISYINKNEIEVTLNELLDTYLSKTISKKKSIIENKTFKSFDGILLEDIRKKAKHCLFEGLLGLTNFYKNKIERAGYALLYIVQLENQQIVSNANSQQLDKKYTDRIEKYGSILENIISNDNIHIINNNLIKESDDEKKESDDEKKESDDEKKEIVKRRCQSVLDKDYSLVYSLGEEIRIYVKPLTFSF